MILLPLTKIEFLSIEKEFAETFIYIYIYIYYHEELLKSHETKVQCSIPLMISFFVNIVEVVNKTKNGEKL